MKEKPTKKIVYVSANGYLGGAERFVLEACSGHLKYGDFHPVVLFFNEGDAIGQFKERGIETHLLSQKFKLSKPLCLLKACLEIRKIFLREEWKVYNSTMAYPQFVMGLALFNLNIRSIWYQHGPVGNVYDRLASLFPHDYILFNSKYTQNCHNAMPLFQEPSVAQEILPYGIPDVLVSEESALHIREEVLASKEQILLLLAGRICSWKGYETGIKAIKWLIEESPKYKEILKLIIVGDSKTERDQSYRDSLVELSSEDSIKENISFLGRKENIHDYMKAADIFLHTSNIPEPFGLVVAEAMAQGTFTIGTNQGGTPDMLIDGVTGFSFDTTSENAPETLSHLIKEYLNLHEKNSKVLDQMRSKGREFIKENFSVPSMVQRLEALYNRLL